MRALVDDKLEINNVPTVHVKGRMDPAIPSSRRTEIQCLTSCCMSNPDFCYIPIYIPNDDLNEIAVVCPTMGTDHFVDQKYFELSNAAS
mmetsp:Transcript_33414/g.80887  ORF Transcript_33414/g.80887 Transcript_33414/m.80887 type:complete len:89 (-) Transcript_33414:156-422(-)